MSEEFERYVKRFVDGGGCWTDQDRELLKASIELLQEVAAFWQQRISPLCAILLTLDPNEPARRGARALEAEGDQFRVAISIEFVHRLVGDSFESMRTIPEYDVRRSILVAVVLILLHELAHVLYGHTDTVAELSARDYRIDETATDFRSGMLLVVSIRDCAPLRACLAVRTPDEISRYSLVGALVLHRHLHELGGGLNCYHKANNRFGLVCAGYMFMAGASRSSEPSRLKPILEKLQQAVEASHDTGWQHVLRADADDNLQMLTETEPHYHARADAYNRRSRIAGKILKLIGERDGYRGRALRRVRTLFGVGSVPQGSLVEQGRRGDSLKVILADKVTRPKLDLATMNATIIVVEVGRRSDLTEEEARQCAEFILRVTQARPETLVGISLGGYDDDPRRVTDIPECAEQLRRLYLELRRFAPRDTYPTTIHNLESQSRVLLEIAMGHVSRNALAIRPPDDPSLIQQLYADPRRLRRPTAG